MGLDAIVGVPANFILGGVLWNRPLAWMWLKEVVYFKLFLRRKESYGKMEKVTHDERGFKRLGELVMVLREFSHIAHGRTLIRNFSMRQGSVGEIEKGIFELAGKSHSKGWVREKLERLDNALSLWAKESRSSSQVIALEGMITLLLALQAQLG